MSSTRLSYDDSVYKSYTRQSTGTNIYTMNKSYVEKLNCFPDVMSGHPKNFISFDENQVGIENNLTNRSVPKTKYNENDNIGTNDLITSIPSFCSDLFSRNSLLTNPKSEFRSLSTESFNRNYLNMNPQDNVSDYVQMFGKNSRKIVLDSFNDKK